MKSALRSLCIIKLVGRVYDFNFDVESMASGWLEEPCMGLDVASLHKISTGLFFRKENK